MRGDISSARTALLRASRQRSRRTRTRAAGVAARRSMRKLSAALPSNLRRVFTL